MLLKGALTSISLAIAAISTVAVPISQTLKDRQDDTSGDGQVTWDKHTIMINGERLFLFSGEFHVNINFFFFICLCLCVYNPVWVNGITSVCLLRFSFIKCLLLF